MVLLPRIRLTISQLQRLQIQNNSILFKRPLSSSTPSISNHPKRGNRGLWLLGTGTALVFAYDYNFNAQALIRTIRTAIYGSLIAIDFKLNFDPNDPKSADKVHERSADRIYRICTENGGLYIKLAQSIAVQAAVLPKPYRDAFANVFDKAPGVPYSEVLKVFTTEFPNETPETAFLSFDPEPVASASIAQVHKARLRPPEGKEWKGDEGWVAVKVRKPSVQLQIEWDLFAYRTLLQCYEYLFDLPVSFVSKYVSEQMRKEVDLANEAENALKTARFLEDEPTLKGRVVVPKVVQKWTGKSVMTAEFIEATKLTDRPALAAKNLDAKETMDLVTNMFAAMVFKWGWLHSDLHPGNVLVRQQPGNPKRPQIVLIDHGLYIPLSNKFRLEYCQLWKSLFTADLSTIEKIAVSWGISRQNSEMFASITMLRPSKLRGRWHGTAAGSAEEEGERSKFSQMPLKERVKTMLENENLIPRELIFLGRTMRMVQANNQSLGSPTNRINIMAHWAATGLKTDLVQHSPALGVRVGGILPWVKERMRLVVFRTVLLAVDVGFWVTRWRQWLLERVWGRNNEGFEDVLQRQVSEMARNEYGIELDDQAFAG
ncbi:ABC1-domain-containing protein [Meredithblackwellia eburnea MCA 4105]